MSMSLNPSTTSATIPLRMQFAFAVARYATRRRGELGLTVRAAAELAGLEVSEWCALEFGWVPEEVAVIRSIAAVLEVSWMDLEIRALFARCAQQAS